MEIPITGLSTDTLRIRKNRYWLLCILGAGILSGGCQTLSRPRNVNETPAPIYWESMPLITTAYCSCERCTGWERDKKGQPVYAYGPSKGKPKRIGLTAAGTMVRKGTLAADTRFFPFGTRIFIPGYGYGTVEDRGGAIKEMRLDLWFASHQEALNWGRQIKMVRVLVTPELPIPDARLEAGKRQATPSGR